MSGSEGNFSIDAELLYERGPDRKDEKLTAIDVLDEFLTNVGRLAKFIEPCKIKVVPKISIEIASAISHVGTDSVIQWGDIKQVHALAPSHPRYNNVVSVWSSRKIYLFHLKSQQAGTFAAYLNATQPQSSTLFDSHKETDIAMLKKCFEELESFVAEEVPLTNKQLDKLGEIDEKILELNGRKRIKRCRRLYARMCCCFGGAAAVPATLDRCILARGAIVTAMGARRQKIAEALETVRHAFLIFTRVAPTLQRIGYCNSQAEFGRKLTTFFAGIVHCAKVLANLPPEPGSPEEETARLQSPPSSAKYSLIASVNSPPLTDAAIKTIETYLPERPELAADWSNFGPNWTLCIHEQEMDWNDWGMPSQQQLKDLNREIDTLRSTLRRSYQQLIERRLIAEVEQTKKLLQERLKDVEQQKQALADGKIAKLEFEFLLERPAPQPARMNSSLQKSFVAEVKKHNGRAVVVIQQDEATAHGAFQVCDKEALEVLEELCSGSLYRVRNADGLTGTVPSSAVIELKL